jgi:hypothetical protein
MEPPTRFLFRWGHPTGVDPQPANSILVEFSLVADGSERTRLRVVESGIDLLAWPDDEKVRYAHEHRAGWMTFMDRLAGLWAGPREGMTIGSSTSSRAARPACGG